MPSPLARGIVVVAAGMAVNLCLGILYAWSVWKSALVPPYGYWVGSPMLGINEGWYYLSNAEATWAYSVCGFVFALSMNPGGRLQDRYGPRLGATLGGLCLAAGCILAGLQQDFIGLLLGFGVLGGIGMGLGYAAATPAAVKWFGPHRRGLIVGLVVSGYGAAAVYIAPLAEWLIGRYGISGSFIGLGLLFAAVVIIAGRLLRVPPEGFVPAGTPAANTPVAPSWTPRAMVATRPFFLLVAMMFASAQSGLLVIPNAKKMLGETAAGVPFLMENAWLLAAFGGIVNASGRVGTGFYSDALGRRNAYAINGLLAVAAMAAIPWAVESKNALLLFVAVGIAYWQYGGGLALLPSFTADLFGAKHLGQNYGLVFLGWGLAFFVPLAAGYSKDWTGRLDEAFYTSAALLFAGVILSRRLKRPNAAS